MIFTTKWLVANIKKRKATKTSEKTWITLRYDRDSLKYTPVSLYNFTLCRGILKNILEASFLQNAEYATVKIENYFEILKGL